MWQGVFGSPDLGPVDFKTLKRRRSPNDALACPRDFCPEHRVDFEPPVWEIPAARLRGLIAEAAAAEPGTVLVDRGEEQDRFVVRTPLMRFPDTVVAQAIPCGDSRSTLALYSRSQIGRSDLGVNKRRLERWVERIGTLAPQERSHNSP